MTEAVYQFTVDFPPSLNNLYATVRGRRVLSSRGRAYKVTAARQALEQGVREPLEGPLAIRLAFYPPDRRRRDGDNLCKALFDSMKGRAWIDDSQLARCEWTKHEPKGTARVEVAIGRYESKGE